MELITLRPTIYGLRLRAARSERLLSLSTPITAPPFSVVVLVESSSVALEQHLVTLGNSGSDNTFALTLAGNTAGDPVQCYVIPFAVASTTTGYRTNQLLHACAVCASSTSRAVYLNGGGKGTNTTSIVPSGINRLAIGGRSNNQTNDTTMEGIIYDVALYNVALSDDEVAESARLGLQGAGLSTVRRTAIIRRWVAEDLSLRFRDLSPTRQHLTLGRCHGRRMYPCRVLACVCGSASCWWRPPPRTPRAPMDA